MTCSSDMRSRLYSRAKAPKPCSKIAFRHLECHARMQNSTAGFLKIPPQRFMHQLYIHIFTIRTRPKAQMYVFRYSGEYLVTVQPAFSAILHPTCDPSCALTTYAAANHVKYADLQWQPRQFANINALS